MKVQDCSVPMALPQSCPKVFGLSAACSSPSSYLGVIKCADTGSSKLAPVSAHLITFIVNNARANVFCFYIIKYLWYKKEVVI